MRLLGASWARGIATRRFGDIALTGDSLPAYIPDEQHYGRGDAPPFGCRPRHSSSWASAPFLVSAGGPVHLRVGLPHSPNPRSSWGSAGVLTSRSLTCPVRQSESEGMFF